MSLFGDMTKFNPTLRPKIDDVTGYVVLLPRSRLPLATSEDDQQQRLRDTLVKVPPPPAENLELNIIMSDSATRPLTVW